MRKSLLIAAIGLFGLLPCTLLAQDMNTPIGTWKTIDDKTGKAKSLVEIYDVNGKLSGRVIETFPEPGKDPDPICDMCTGALHNKKIKGLVIMWGFSKDGDAWSGGHIFDPKEKGSNEDPYRAKLTPSNGGQDLKVRGYLAFFWRTQVWHRVK